MQKQPKPKKYIQTSNLQLMVQHAPQIDIQTPKQIDVGYGTWCNMRLWGHSGPATTRTTSSSNASRGHGYTTAGETPIASMAHGRAVVGSRMVGSSCISAVYSVPSATCTCTCTVTMAMSWSVRVTTSGCLTAPVPHHSHAQNERQDAVCASSESDERQQRRTQDPC